MTLFLLLVFKGRSCSKTMLAQMDTHIYLHFSSDLIVIVAFLLQGFQIPHLPLRHSPVIQKGNVEMVLKVTGKDEVSKA